jgi:hypothetical protein
MGAVDTDDTDFGAENGDPKAFDKLLDRALAKCDASKRNLDTLWTTQILAVVLSIALVFGLDDVASEALLHVAGYGGILDIILPLANLYFSIRFGIVILTFAESRYSAEKLSEKYLSENKLDSSLGSDEFWKSILRNMIFSTNSYFKIFFRNRKDTFFTTI